MDWKPILLITLLLAGCTAPTVQRGDTVFVTYTGRFQNGTIFDSNDPSNAALFAGAPTSKFTPVVVKIGSGQMIPGFENAVIGMKQGETKTVLIKASQAYGGYDPSKSIKIPKIIEYPAQTPLRRTVEVPVAQLQSDLKNRTAVGTVFDTQNFQYNITKVNTTTATLYLLKPLHNQVQLTGTYWNSSVLSTTQDTLTYKAEVPDGSVIQTPLGPYFAYVNATTIHLNTTFRAGDTAQSEMGRGRVMEQSQDALVIDFNHPLAGYDLNFTVTVNTLQPQAGAK